jgi:hypothetical protein
MISGHLMFDEFRYRFALRKYLKQHRAVRSRKLTGIIGRTESR